jgi:hypothetical protein
MAKSVSMILKEYEQFKLAQTEEAITEEDKKLGQVVLDLVM